MADEMKTCIQCCEEKSKSEFWCAVKGTTRVVSRCKPCHVLNRRRYKYNRPSKPRVKKVRGFAGLPEDVRAGVLEMMGEGAKKNAIAAKYDIPYPSFCYWCKKGRVK
jgi:hypothetical protein